MRTCILKAALIDGGLYEGHCRNAKRARWNAAANCFEYERYKGGMTFSETICHPEDDDGYDLFLPDRYIPE